LDTVDWL